MSNSNRNSKNILQTMCYKAFTKKIFFLPKTYKKNIAICLIGTFNFTTVRFDLALMNMKKFSTVCDTLRNEVK